MIGGAIAVLRVGYELKTPTLTTMHSWLGICTIAMFSLNFLWGIAMAMLTRCYPDSVFGQAFDLSFIHKCIGLLVIDYIFIIIKL